ncbi:hypothetical protein ABBQ38_013193 [Trebouxia sp. C0009 RCD-2024]
MSALKRLAPLAPRLTTSNFSRQQQRGFAASVGHGDAKVNCWEQPTNISNWKEEHVRNYVFPLFSLGKLLKFLFEGSMHADCVCCFGMLGSRDI